MNKWFINLSIQRRILFSILGITIGILLASSFSLYVVASKSMMEQTKKQSAGVIHELSVNLDHYFEKVENSFGYIANNNTVQEELKSDSPYRSDGTELYSYYSVAGQIRRLLLKGYTSVYMNDIQLYGYNGANHLVSNERAEYTSETKERVWKLAQEAKGSCVYYNQAKEEGVIYIAKEIKDALTMEPLGVLCASIKAEYLEKMTEAARESLTARIFLLDGEEKPILKDEEILPKWEKRLTGQSGIFLTNREGQSYSCVYMRSSNTGFILMGMIPMSYLQKTAHELLKTTVMLLFTSIILCAILANVLARGIADPIARTSKAMERFAGGDFTVRLPENRGDEIGAMNVVFNHTIEEVEHLLKKIVEMETVNKDIEFQTLQAQVNPHFLYNVLDTINWMARKKGEEKICRMVTAVSGLMRASISNRKSMVSVREEMKYLEDYLYIQETRYGDKFVSCVEVEEGLYDLQIPKMTIQTLVENAVVHGIENATWECYLYVTGEIQEGFGIFTVKDNGVGMSREQLHTLETSGKQVVQEGETHTHLGIYAVKKRLDYVCNGKAQMQITSQERQGTKIVLTIPLRDRRSS